MLYSKLLLLCYTPRLIAIIVLHSQSTFNNYRIQYELFGWYYFYYIVKQRFFLCLERGDHCSGNQGKVRENEKGLKYSGRSQGTVREFEKERGKSGKSQAILTICPEVIGYHSSVSTWWSQFLPKMLHQGIMENFPRSGRSQRKVRENESRKKVATLLKFMLMVRFMLMLDKNSSVTDYVVIFRCCFLL